jgi:hypothetical protein
MWWHSHAISLHGLQQMLTRMLQKTGVKPRMRCITILNSRYKTITELRFSRAISRVKGELNINISGTYRLHNQGRRGDKTKSLILPWQCKDGLIYTCQSIVVRVKTSTPTMETKQSSKCSFLT